MNKHIVYLSLFDGISAGRLAMTRSLHHKKIPFTYYSSEIDKNAMRITNHNFPDTIQLGDVRHLHKGMFPYEIGIVTGGSPCQNFSFAGKRKGMTTEELIEILTLKQYLKLKEEGFQFKGESYLFWEFVRMVDELKPKYFLLENVRMSKKWEDVISKALGVKPIKINSSTVSAQNRYRLYWTNIPDVLIPEDKEIQLSDLIPGAKGYGERGKWIPELRKCIGVSKTIRKDGKANCLVTTNSPTQ